MRPFSVVVSVILVCCSLTASGQAENGPVISALKKNDHVALASCFHTMVDLQIPGSSGNFSQTQASVILKKFFTDHSITSVSITREGTKTDGSNYTLGELVTGGKTYRLYFVTRDTNGKEKVHQFQVTEI